MLLVYNLNPHLVGMWRARMSLIGLESEVAISNNLVSTYLPKRHPVTLVNGGNA